MDVEVTDPDHPRPEKRRTVGARARAQLARRRHEGDGRQDHRGGQSTPPDTGIKAATSKETKRAIAAVAETPKNLGSWWERDAKGWLNNVAARATGGKSKTDHSAGFPAARPKEDGGDRRDASGRNGYKRRGAKKNGAQAPERVDGVDRAAPSEKNE